VHGTLWLPFVKNNSLSVVAGGVLELSKQTRFTPLISLMMRIETSGINSESKLRGDG